MSIFLSEEKRKKKLEEKILAEKVSKAFSNGGLRLAPEVYPVTVGEVDLKESTTEQSDSRADHRPQQKALKLLDTAWILPLYFARLATSLLSRLERCGSEGAQCQKGLCAPPKVVPEYSCCPYCTDKGCFPGQGWAKPLPSDSTDGQRLNYKSSLQYTQDCRRLPAKAETLIRHLNILLLILFLLKTASYCFGGAQSQRERKGLQGR